MILPVPDMAAAWPAPPTLSRDRRLMRLHQNSEGEMTMSRLSSLSTIVAGVALLAACTDQRPAATGPGLSASQNGLPFTEGLASPAWQEKVASLVSQAGLTPQTEHTPILCWASRS